jgi:hypothetical protein
MSATERKRKMDKGKSDKKEKGERNKERKRPGRYLDEHLWKQTNSNQWERSERRQRVAWEEGVRTSQGEQKSLIEAVDNVLCKSVQVRQERTWSISPLPDRSNSISSNRNRSSDSNRSNNSNTSNTSSSSNNEAVETSKLAWCASVRKREWTSCKTTVREEIKHNNRNHDAEDVETTERESNVRTNLPGAQPVNRTGESQSQTDHGHGVQLLQGLDGTQQEDDDAATLNCLNGTSKQVGRQRLEILPRGARAESEQQARIRQWWAEEPSTSLHATQEQTRHTAK